MSNDVFGDSVAFALDDIWEFIAADITPLPVMFWAVGKYLVIYRAERSPIEIVAVTQGSRDIPASLRRRV